MPDRRREDLLRLVHVAAGIEHVVELGAVLGPLLDLVEIAVAREQRLISLLLIARQLLCKTQRIFCTILFNDDKDIGFDFILAVVGPPGRRR